MSIENNRNETSTCLFDKKEMLAMLKHLGDEYAGAKITSSKPKQIEALQEAVALLTNYLGDAEIRLMVKRFIVLS